MPHFTFILSFLTSHFLRSASHGYRDSVPTVSTPEIQPNPKSIATNSGQRRSHFCEFSCSDFIDFINLPTTWCLSSLDFRRQRKPSRDSDLLGPGLGLLPLGHFLMHVPLTMMQPVQERLVTMDRNMHVSWASFCSLSPPTRPWEAQPQANRPLCWHSSIGSSLIRVALHASDACEQALPFWSSW